MYKDDTQYFGEQLSINDKAARYRKIRAAQLKINRERKERYNALRKKWSDKV